MKRISVLASVLAVLIVAGCGQSEEAASMEKKIQKHEKQLAALEKIIYDLEAKQEAEKGIHDFQARVDKLQKWYTDMKYQMDSLTEAKQETVRAMVKEEIELELASIEARKEEQREEKRKRWQQQAEEQRARREEQRSNEAAKTLKLTDEQKEKAKTFTAETRKIVRDTFTKMYEEGSLNREKMQETMKKITTQRETALKEILSDEQFETFQKLEEHERTQMLGLWGGQWHGSQRRGERDRTRAEGEGRRDQEKDQRPDDNRGEEGDEPAPVPDEE